MSRRDLFLAIAWNYLGTPYKWGGDDPTAFDCSGLVNECAQSVGLMPSKEDRTAAVWATFGTPVAKGDEQPGDLIFWKDKDGKVYHVEIVYAILPVVGVVTIGASGGGSKTLTVADAIAQNAYVKMRPAKPNGFVRRNTF